MPEPLPDDTLVVYVDYVCPFCYLGKRTLETYLDDAQDPPPVEWRPFDLRLRQRRPDGSLDPDTTDGKTQAYYDRAKENVQRLQKEYGVDMAHELAPGVDAWNAHKVALHVRGTEGREPFLAFNDALFEALWRRSEDIGAPDTLARVADRCGLESSSVRQAATRQELDQAIWERFKASHKQGITGVPTFLYNELRLPGALPPEQIANLVQEG